MMRIILILFLTLGLINLTHAEPSASLEEHIAALNQKSFKAKITVIENLAATGDTRVVPLL